MTTILSLISLGIWVYLLGFRGAFWRSGPVLANRVPGGAAKIAIIIPARDEAEGIGRALASLLAQDHAGELHIVLVDDNSTDGTAGIAGDIAAGDPRLTVVQGQDLPPGWSGKMWAVAQGLAHPAAQAAEYVLLTDADIEHAPGHVSALVTKAERDGLELVSEMVRLSCASLAERALIPAFVFFFQMLYPFRWTADPSSKSAGAAGGTMLVKRAALDRIGGVERIRHTLIDDCALARAIKSTGGKIWLGHAEKAVSLRVYGRPAEIWNMIARTAYEQLGRSPVMLAGCTLGMILTYLAPPLLALFGHGVARALGIAAWLAMAWAFQPTLRRYRRAPFWGLALPGIALFYTGATIASALRHHGGKGGGWKNRVYPEIQAAP